MRVRLDECVDRRLAGDIQGHDVKTVPEAGWAALKNGDLLARAEREFDVFITVDVGVTFLHNPGESPLTVVLLRAPSNRLDALLPLIPRALDMLTSGTAGQVIRIGDR